MALGALADAPPASRRSAAALHAAILLAAAAAIAIGLSGAAPVEIVAVPVLAGVVALAAARLMLGWTTLVGLLCVVILFIPIRRYSLPGGLPFELEPYRLLVVLVVAGWTLSLLSDRSVRMRRSGFEGPLALFGISVLGSLAFNVDRIVAFDVSADVVKRVMFFLTFFLMLILIVSVVRTRQAIDTIVNVLVVGGTIIAVFALYEARTGYNVFDHLNQWIPGLQVADIPEVPGRGARLRVYASAQHPIALGAALAMLLPLAIYLAQTQRRRIWYACLVVLGVGVVATVSRTSIVMLVVVAIIFLWLRPRETRRLWPALILLPIVAHIALPGAMGAIREAFFPAGGLVAEQSALPGYRGSGRVADLGPSIAEWKQQPVFGQGFGTRITDARARERPHLGQPVARQPARHRRDRRDRAGLAVRARGAPLRTRGEGGSLRAWLAARGRDGVVDRLRHQHVHLRRLLVHPGDRAAVHPARPRLERVPARRAPTPAPRSRGCPSR